MIKNIILINKSKNMNLWYMITNKQYNNNINNNNNNNNNNNHNKQYNHKYKYKNNLIITKIKRYTQT